MMILAAVAVTPLLLARQVVALRESGTLHELKGSHETEERFRSLVTNSSDTIFVTDEETSILYATPSALSVLGYVADDLAEHRLSDLVHPDDRSSMLSLVAHCASQPVRSARGEWRMSDHEGTWHFTETVIANLLEDPHVHGLVFTSRDIGERIRFQNELQHQAFHDALTGLANRVLFKDRVEHALAGAARTGVDVAVLFMDIDDFKLVNDSYGHVLGDNLLVQVAQRVRGMLRVSDTAARLGGDEFAILLEGATDLDEACRVAQRVLDLFDEGFSLDSTHLSISVSVGVAVSDGSHTSAEELLRDADVAMYSAKAHGKDRLEVFEPAMQAAVYERLELANELRRAVERNEFVVFYQPIIEIKTQRIVGTEALVRWDHPREGLKLPGWFIQVAEETGLIIPIGDFVLDQACRQLRQWGDRFQDTPLRMSVNLSPRQIKDPLLVEKVSAALATSGIDPARAHARDHRDRAGRGQLHHPGEAQGAQGARHTTVDRRLRHRLLVAELSAPVPGGRCEDRQAVRRPRGRRRGPLRPRAGHHHPGRDAPARGRGRRHRAGTADARAAAAGLQARARDSTRHAPSTRRVSPGFWPLAEARPRAASAAAGRGRMRAPIPPRRRSGCGCGRGTERSSGRRGSPWSMRSSSAVKKWCRLGRRLGQSRLAPSMSSANVTTRLLPEVVGVGVRTGQLLETELDVETVG